MSHKEFDDGVYMVLSEVDGVGLFVDWQDGKPRLCPFTGHESQQWLVKSVPGIGSSFQNVASEMYLGLSSGDPMESVREVKGVKDPFPWQARKTDGSTGYDWNSLWVPFTKNPVYIERDSTHYNPNSGSILYVHEAGRNDYGDREWRLCKDLHLALTIAIQNQGVYNILNDESKTVLGDSNGQVLCFHVDADTDAQKFLAIKTEIGWAFRNVESQRYLGLPMAADLTDGIRLPLVEHHFTWIVVPDWFDSSKFKICIPFTSRVMNLQGGSTDNGTRVHVQEARRFGWHWWRFQAAPNEQPPTRSATVTGPPELLLRVLT